MRVTNRTVSRRVSCALAILALLGTGATAEAGPITVGNGWEQFTWSGAPNATNIEGGFTFTAAGPVTLSVTDTHNAGDVFEVFDNNVSLGLTSLTNGFPAYQPDPNLAFFNPDFSSGVFALGAGSHSLTFVTVYNPVGQSNGAAYFRVDGQPVNQVPEPGALALACLGVGGLAVARLRRGIARRPSV